MSSVSEHQQSHPDGGGGGEVMPRAPFSWWLTSTLFCRAPKLGEARQAEEASKTDTTIAPAATTPAERQKTHARSMCDQTTATKGPTKKRIQHLTVISSPYSPTIQITAALPAGSSMCFRHLKECSQVIIDFLWLSEQRYRRTKKSKTSRTFFHRRKIRQHQGHQVARF